MRSTAIYQTLGDAPIAIFMASPPDLSASLAELREVLGSAARAPLAQLRPAETVYCAVLPHSPASKKSVVPDEILLGLAARRPPTSEGQQPSYAPCYLEEAGALVVEMDGAALAEVRTQIALALRAEDDHEQVRKALVATATVLNQQDWSDVLDAADDFLVLPLNADGSDLEQHL